MTLSRVARLAIVALVALIVPAGVRSPYLMGVLHLALVYVILVQGFNFTQGFLGRTSLGHVGFWAIGAYATALLTTRFVVAPLVAMVVGATVAGFVAVALAVLTNRMQAFYLALATLGFAQIVQIVANNWIEVTRGSNGVTGIPYFSWFGLEFASRTSQYYMLVAVVALGGWLTQRFVTTRLGREAFAIRQSEVAAESLGIRTNRLKTVTLVISAVYAAVGGSLYAHTFVFISPDVFSFGAMLLILAMLVVGGQQTVWGPVVGAVVVTILPELFRVSDEYYLLIYGLVLYAAMVKMPGGLVGLLRGVRTLRRRDPPPDTDSESLPRPSVEAVVR
jgi:branched-chain amino acid transport system permease protein